MSGKQLSLLSKIIAACYVLGMNLGYLIIAKTLPSTDMEWGIIQAGIFFALLFAPVDISMVVTNMLGTRKKES